MTIKDLKMNDYTLVNSFYIYINEELLEKGIFQWAEVEGVEPQNIDIWIDEELENFEDIYTDKWVAFKGFKINEIFETRTEDDDFKEVSGLIINGVHLIDTKRKTRQEVDIIIQKLKKQRKEST